MSTPKEELHRLVDRLPEQNIARRDYIYLDWPESERALLAEGRYQDSGVEFWMNSSENPNFKVRLSSQARSYLKRADRSYQG